MISSEEVENTFENVKEKIWVVQGLFYGLELLKRRLLTDTYIYAFPEDVQKSVVSRTVGLSPIVTSDRLP